jgi:hypothetical protein
MLRNLSIKSLYTLALAEGEGLGTAYEYYAKRLLISRWLSQFSRPRRLLIAGLPEKYGASLDFLELSAELGAEVIVVDDRPKALERLRISIDEVGSEGILENLNWRPVETTNLGSLKEIEGNFDLCVCSEVLQRLEIDSRVEYVARLTSLASALALFVPNADNASHANLSGLTGLYYEDLTTLFGAQQSQVGFIDMPPFPPGITRSDEQREEAATGNMESVAMRGLAFYARLERFLPRSIRRRQSHIVYSLTPAF